MAIDRTGISSLDAGASNITYEGNEGPKSPQEKRIAIAKSKGYSDEEIMEYEDYRRGMEEGKPGYPILEIDEYFKSPFAAAQGGPAEVRGPINSTYTQKRKQLLAGGGIAGLKNRPGYFLGNLVDKIKDDLIPNEIKENPILSTAIAGLALNQWGLPFKIGSLEEGAGKDWIGDLLKDATKGTDTDDKKSGIFSNILTGAAAIPGKIGDVASDITGLITGSNFANWLGTPSDIGGQQVNWKQPLAIGLGIGALDKATRKDETLPAQPGINIADISSRALTGSDSDLRFLPPASATTAYAQGGRIGAQEGGLMDLGGMEKDYRNEGGFVPIGGQERADDVPARLSKNEFVFTADAVRSAGGGDIDKGAEVMENVMEHLEQGGQISEESQGLEGARNMFATAQRLEGVL
jgi:hypothetical protein